LSSFALDRLARWNIGQIFPGLSSETVLGDLPLTTRARNAFARFGYCVASDLQGAELADLLSWPQIGVGTVDSILQCLGDAATGTAAPVLRQPRADATGRYRHTPAAADQLTSWEASFLDDLRLIASWYVAIGTPAKPLLDGPLSLGTPPEIAKARQRLEQISAGDVLDQERAELDAAELLDRVIGGLDPRAQEILAQRFFADEPETLDELGRAMGVTRERVRQIEAKARANLVESLETVGALKLVSAAVRELVGTVLPLDSLLQLLPALARTVEAVHQPAWRILDRLDDAYEIEDGWCVAPTMLGAQEVTQTRLLELANPYGVVRLADVGVLNPNLPPEIDGRALVAWLRHCDYVLDGDFVLTRTRSLGDRAASILSIVGSPLSSQKLLDRFGIERSVSSLKNAMAIDDRFERVDRDRWALTEWGLASYSGVRALVREEVARAGGHIAMETLIEHITGKYSVSASSVVAYASAAPFEVKGSIVRLALGDQTVRKTPERTRRLYRRGDAWLYRIRVTKDHLRGSGSVAPMAIASILGLQFGRTRQLETPLGPQSITWTGNQPAFGTIRRFLIADDIGIDRELFLVIGDDGTFGTELVQPLIHEPLTDALTLIGATSEKARATPRMTLAAAIGLPAESPGASVIGGFRERGDADIADLLVAARSVLDDGATSDRPAPSAEIAEILDLL
jgi:RNA polymerase sigma factor (sigma-70 family)